MGMGLSICQATVQAWGGSLRAENHPEGGAVFTFDLPLNDKTPMA
jgi:K+-sensing histidine kinase KdpD